MNLYNAVSGEWNIGELVKLTRSRSPWDDGAYIWYNWTIKRVSSPFNYFIARNTDGRWFWSGTLKGIKELLPTAETAYNYMPRVNVIPIVD